MDLAQFLTGHLMQVVLPLVTMQSFIFPSVAVEWDAIGGFDGTIG